MYEAGMSCVRINTAHGNFEQYAKIISEAKSIDDIPIMIDIKGPEVRVRMEKEIAILANQEFEFGFAQGKLPFFSYNFLKFINEGDVVYFDNGVIEATLTKKNETSVLLKFKENCTLKPNKGVNLPGKELGMPSLSDKDRQSVEFAIRTKANFIALSFARNRNDVIELRKLLGNSGIAIISKIENHEGLNNIDEIIKNSEGIMIARGDLGVEIPSEKIPFLQKEIIKKCNNAGKISIVATQMLESMTTSKIPTRAEVSDVANAVLDGADAVMLSGETASGNYPVESVKVMKRISCEVENDVRHNVSEETNDDISMKISSAAYMLGESSNASKMICITRSGFSARLVSRYRPSSPILAVTDSHEAFQQMKLVWGIKPVLLDELPLRLMMPRVSEELLKKKLISPDDFAVFLGGIRTLEKNVCNLVEIHNIQNLIEYKEHLVESA